ncbi:MAG TPA: TIGR04552 family protein [Polyangiaceae bacterium LLY-WYZ-15_(1-7)]|nr:TIGR04552 family protein [Sandaracinus sp.]HJK91472.1 TIGR04552 family protein [Polyangiaceae bacterium LLY-WYZ-15_(1-7)]MBJ72353.1 TIGR04552 family protein [Sandaracinus sp.]HJL02812.1 TIGR04552 family protein [Polyangiaceae bacterium LLY-WYZ-15_(1-7)]HJL13221.1 TIGR04552 family protein [Polyangiaceae bacterium LLY-WYZ-15_(1-7)]
MSTDLPEEFRALSRLTLAELESIRLLLRGGSVIDWHRLNFRSRPEIDRFLRAHEIDLADPVDRARTEAIKNAATSYLRRKFDFPIPKPVADEDLAGLLELASTKGHRQLCACTILKVMHIIHHLEARELLFMLPTSDEEVFHLVEQKVYRVVGDALAKGFPYVEFIGGRKNKDSLYTKLLSKQEVSAAQIYDKLRFRLVTRTRDDVFPVLNHLMREVFPFNYVIPRESTNTLIPFRAWCESKAELKRLLPGLQLSLDLEDEGGGLVDNVFSSEAYRVVHFVVDMPVRLPEAMLAEAPPAAWALGRVIFVQTEFQVLDEQTDRSNEKGDASHAAYKQRQQEAVMTRLKVGIAGTREEPGPGRRKTIPPGMFPTAFGREDDEK